MSQASGVLLASPDQVFVFTTPLLLHLIRHQVLKIMLRPQGFCRPPPARSVLSAKWLVRPLLIPEYHPRPSSLSRPWNVPWCRPPSPPPPPPPSGQATQPRVLLRLWGSLTPTSALTLLRVCVMVREQALGVPRLALPMRSSAMLCWIRIVMCPAMGRMPAALGAS